MTKYLIKFSQLLIKMFLKSIICCSSLFAVAANFLIVPSTLAIDNHYQPPSETLTIDNSHHQPSEAALNTDLYYGNLSSG